MAKYIVLALIAVSSVAQARPSSYKMTCAQAQGLVRDNGRIVMNYGYHAKAGHLYKMYVKSSIQCDHGDLTVPAWVPTLDSDRCYIGYTCEERSSNR